MTVVKPFRAVRPAEGFAEKVAALPYDVMSSDEAREMVSSNPYSFLHVDKAEIDLPPTVDIYDAAVYGKAKQNLEQLVSDGTLTEDPDAKYYIYRLIMDGRAQTGLVGCASIDDYLNNHIKKHEFTRADKEADRIRHVDTLDANTGPIFLTCRPNESLSAVISEVTKAAAPIYDFTAEDGVTHTVWGAGGAVSGRIARIFGDIDALYIADGHHRCASAVKVGLKRREENPDYSGDEEFNFFLSVIFPSDQLHILDYNRAVKDLNGLSAEQFLEKIGESFSVEPYEGGEYHPEARHTFGLYLEDRWYKLVAKDGICDENDPVARLDVSILQDRLLSPILGIGDPRTDKRIDFIGGIRGLAELERRVKTDMKVAFAMYATTIDELMDIADADLIMPPKSTWFEPKLRSGLFIHRLT